MPGSSWCPLLNSSDPFPLPCTNHLHLQNSPVPILSVITFPRLAQWDAGEPHEMIYSHSPWPPNGRRSQAGGDFVPLDSPWRNCL